MNKKYLWLIVLLLAGVINACSPFAIVRSSTSYQDRSPVVDVQPPVSGYQPVIVDDVQVDVGIDSPAQAHVRVSGVLPDECAQIEYGEVQQDGTNFIIKLSAIPGSAECTRDTLPFLMSIPLNIADLPAGSYSATVNGVRGDFRVAKGTPPHHIRQLDWPFVKRDIKVENVKVVVGLGSPLPAHAIVEGELPNSCSWLGEVRLHRDKTTYFVELLSYLPAPTDCDPAPIPFRLEIPLNTVNLPDGSYAVNANGTIGGFQMPLASEALAPAGWETFTSQQCEYMISYPPEMQSTEQNPYSRTLAFKLANPDEGARNFIYLSVIPPGIQDMVEQGVYQNDVYNYEPAVRETLLAMKVGESGPVHQNPNVGSGFTYLRQPDRMIGDYTAKTYENVQPWEFPPGTKEIRYYVSFRDCTYLIGGYMDTTGANQPGAITEDLFRQIIATVQLLP